MAEKCDAISVLLENEPRQLSAAVDSLLKICENILRNPNEEKYRRINLNSETVTKNLMVAIGAFEILFLLGFEEGNDKLILPSNAPLNKITDYRTQLLALKQRICGKDKKKPVEVKPKPKPEPVTNAALMLSEARLKAQLETELGHMHYFEIIRYQEAALTAIPVEELRDKAKRMLPLINENLASDAKPMDIQDCLLNALLAWFKQDFFTWFNRGQCKDCSIEMESIGYLEPTSEEKMFAANRVEGYQCSICWGKDRFPRYFDPLKLLSTRKGRCMEWASCFTLMCRALGMDARYVWDKTDHVWTEVFSYSQDRWLHADCCENKLDSPLIYERGWNKKLSYIFAFSKDEVVDVICRYSANLEDVSTRRDSARQQWLVETLEQINTKHQIGFSNDHRKKLLMRRVQEIAQFFAPPKATKEGEVEGRQSGSLEWRLARGENDLSSAKSFTFQPSDVEISKGEMIVDYSSALNEYQRQTGSKELVSTITSWENGVFRTKNLFRKHEKDWNCVYIARMEGCSEGLIEWKVDWTESRMTPTSLSVRFEHVTYENGSVHWKICTDDLCFDGNKNGKMELSEEDLSGAKSFRLSVHLAGGKGDVAWQHAQLFRQTDTDTNFPFRIHLKFK